MHSGDTPKEQLCTRVMRRASLHAPTPLNIIYTQLYDADCADIWESLVVLETAGFIHHSNPKALAAVRSLQ